MSDEQAKAEGAAVGAPSRPDPAPAEGPELPQHASKREALVRLRDRYLETRDLVSLDEPHANLEWILGARRNPTQDPLGWETRTIELVALWLQDLAVEVERRLPPPPTDALDESGLSAYHARQAAAGCLRDATEGFLVAFRRPS